MNTPLLDKLRGWVADSCAVITRVGPAPDAQRRCLTWREHVLSVTAIAVGLLAGAHTLDSKYPVSKLAAPVAVTRPAVDPLAGLDETDRLFVTLASTLESMSDKVYYDGDGARANIGYGYCLTKRLGKINQRSLEASRVGYAQVIADMERAGLTSAQIRGLTSDNRKLRESVRITKEQALGLLVAVLPEYRARAVSHFGEVLNELKPNRAAAILWLTYNSDIKQFKKLAQAVKTLDHQTVLANLTPRFRNAKGRMVKNKRAEGWLKLTYRAPSVATVVQAAKHPLLTEIAFKGERDKSNKVKLAHRVKA